MSYTYNALSQRVFKSDARLSGANNPAITQQTVCAEDGIGSTVLGQYGNRRSSNSAAPAGEMDSTEVIYLPTASGPMPVAAQINGRLYAIDADHLNTPRRLTNTQGQVVWQWLITGFGEANPTTGATGYAQSGQGSANYAEAIKFDLRYPGQVWDEETGLAYNLNRYYDREGGRYIQADPIGLEGGWNRYLYAGGTPTNLVDPSGLASVMPGGGLADSPLLDNGSSCSPMFQQPRVDDGGCIATSGGPSICIGPGSIKGVGNNLSGLTKEQLKSLIGPEQTQLLRNVFGSGISGANNSMSNLSRPVGLTDEALSAYRELALRAINSYEQTGNAAGAALQRLRLDILNRIAK
ncbi:RHS repeat-associated core domain-containing protein [Acidovorax sp. SUPP1855]|uniref:RHS repeat-associated core domain-containing protein n=1 Tax=Acidovorax sp. SUPP1855 TaxID=431774 RepID=UPI0023DE3677|nr:RHS repeat-associated core domain-containing protein [Acidovorax sp. SUPP1855]GKS85427.1 RHS repeat-associated core domain-containing protein [Acidovorax sp. SUPP1855]